MMRFLAFVFGLFALVACDDDDGPTAQRVTSPGGLEYTLISMMDHADISIHAAWETDWAYRSDTNKTAPEVGAQLILAGGAEGFPAGEVVERFADMNSEGSIYTVVHDHVVGALTFPRDNLDETIEIASAHLTRPLLDAAWFERVRDGVSDQINAAQQSPGAQGGNAARWAIFGDTPMRDALSLSDAKAFSTLTRQDIATWHVETFTNTPAAIVVTGGADEETASAAIDRLFEGLPSAPRKTTRSATADFSAKRILLHVPDAPNATLTFIGQLPPTRDGGEMEDLLLISALGAGDQSVLFEAVRSGLRASYGYTAGYSNYTRDLRVLYLTGELETAKLAEAETVVREAYAKYLADGPAGVLGARKSPFAANFASLSDFVVDLANSELQSALDGHPEGRALGLNAELDSVTPDDLDQRLRSAFPSADDMIVIAVSPDADALVGACVIQKPIEAMDC